MSIERDGEYRFDADGVYTKEEFLWRASGLLETSFDLSEQVEIFLIERIVWAEGLPDNVVIGFWEDEYGVIRPWAGVNFEGLD